MSSRHKSQARLIAYRLQLMYCVIYNNTGLENLAFNIIMD